MPRPSTPVSTKANPRSGVGCARLFLLTFFAFGFFFFYLIVLQPLWSIWRARSWEEIPCRIVSSEVKRIRGSKSVTYKIVIQYTYEVNGRPFQADRYDFFTGSSSGHSGKQKVVDRYPEGSTAVCYVNLEQPTEAVLHRGLTNALWWGLIPLPFMAIGLLAFLPSRMFVNTTSKSGPLRSTGASKPAMPPRATPSQDILAGPTELRASASPIGKLVGLSVFALVWNGIISIFVRTAWEGISRQRPEWFLIIFLIPFVLVGLGALVGVGYAFLNLFNPRISLRVSTAAIPLGGNADVEWSIQGSSQRIKSLSMTLEGVERATYRRGTDTTTDRHVFAKIPVVETGDPTVIKAGAGRIAIPSSLMHSFKAPNNEIAWTLKVNGSIPRFPDVSEEFPLTVIPHTQVPI